MKLISLNECQGFIYNGSTAIVFLTLREGGYVYTVYYIKVYAIVWWLCPSEAWYIPHFLIYCIKDFIELEK